MKAIVYTKYGPPEVLLLKEVEKPVPKDKEVLVKVHVATVTATDCTFRKGEPLFARLFTGLLKPKQQVLGSEFAGEVAAIGENVELFKQGDQVVGTTPGSGCYVEYLTLPEDTSTLAVKSDSTTYEEAIACCDGFLTALSFLRDKGQIRSGQKVLINGASGSVGSAAVQLAKYFGAEVAGVCSTANIELVKSLGADEVIDYTKEDFTKKSNIYDIIFDTVGKVSFPRCKNALKENGIFIETKISLGIIFHVLISSKFGDKKATFMATGLRPPRERTKDLVFIRELLEKGKIKPVIDRSFPMEQIVEAHRYVEQGHKKGNVVITVAHDNE